MRFEVRKIHKASALFIIFVPIVNKNYTFMNNFSLYDILAIILPGCTVLSVLRYLAQALGMDTSPLHANSWEYILFYSLIIGLGLYVFNYWLRKNAKAPMRYLGIYRHVADIYQADSRIHALMNETLNSYAQRHKMGKPFMTSKEYEQLDSKSRNETKEQQNLFYDYLYNLLNEKGALGGSKYLQCYYLFTCNSFIGMSLVVALLVGSILVGLCYTNIHDLLARIGYPLISTLVAIQIFFLLMCRFFRKRMVQRMYWSYFHYLSDQNK